MRQHARLVPLLRLAAVAAIVAGAAAWSRPTHPAPRAQVCHGGAYTLTVVEPTTR